MATVNIKNEILNLKEKMIFASEVYQRYFSNSIKEEAFFKAIERLYRSKQIEKVSKGIYCIPLKTCYGKLTISDEEIVNYFIANQKGMLVGGVLFNKLGLTTQVPKTIEIYSSLINKQTKTIGGVFIRNKNIDFNNQNCEMISSLEMLEHFNEIQDLNYKEFVKYIKNICSNYSDEVFDCVIKNINYKTCTISFLKNILDFYKVENRLSRYLSSFSKYKHPTMKQIYELAQI